MASSRSNRSSVSGSSNTSSVPSERSGYAEDADVNGKRASSKTVRYTRGGTLTSAEPHWAGREHVLQFHTYPPPGRHYMSCGSSIFEAGQTPKVGQVYYQGSSKWIDAETMKSRSHALTIDRAAKILRHEGRRDNIQSPALEALKTAVKSGAAAKPSLYVGCITKIKSVPEIGIEKVIVCSRAGHHLSIKADCFQESSTLTVGSLVYRQADGGRYIARVG